MSDTKITAVPGGTVTGMAPAPAAATAGAVPAAAAGSGSHGRLAGLPPYVLAEVAALRDRLRHEGHDIIDLSMGNPDAPPPPHVVERLTKALSDPRLHRYPPTAGLPGLRKAVAGWYGRRFGVTLDPQTQVVATPGSKAGLAAFCQAAVGPGDIVASPDPGYPIHALGFVIAGAQVAGLSPEPGRFLADLERMAATTPPRVVVVNYPANPTGLVADAAFYQAAVDLCRRMGAWLVSDIAYAELYYDGDPPPSVLSAEGAMEVAVEFSSVSKTYSMAGWRIGFCAGAPHLVAALSKMRSYLDYGSFAAAQVAAAAALNGPQDCVTEMRERYRRRRDVFVGGLRRAGWDVPSPSAGMFVWAPLPPAFRSMGSVAFARLLIEEAGVAAAAGAGFGPGGEGHVRFALVENEHRLRQAVRGVRSLLHRQAAA